MTLTASEIETLIEGIERTDDEWDEGPFTWAEWWYEDVPTPIEMPGIGTLAIEETFGGEGEGDHAHVVLRLTDPAGNVRFFKKDGYYSSYYGTDMDGYFSEVRPVEKTITVFQ